MTSQLYIGQVLHARLAPIHHTFVYPGYVYALDVSELPQLHTTSRLFGYNKVRLVAIHDKDYLGDGAGSLVTKLMLLLREKAYCHSISRILLVTGARYCHMAFNPVSFFYCFGAAGTLHCVVAEVKNTYGETHIYVLDQPAEPAPGFLACYRAPKAFFVSPFNDLQGEYEFHFSALDAHLDIRVNLLRAGRVVLRTRLWGQALPLDDVHLRRTLLHYPLVAALTLPRIVWQGLILRYKKGLPPYLKPNPTSPMTIRMARPSALRRLRRRVTSVQGKVIRRLAHGRRSPHDTR